VVCGSKVSLDRAPHPARLIKPGKVIITLLDAWMLSMDAENAVENARENGKENGCVGLGFLDFLHGAISPSRPPAARPDFSGGGRDIRFIP
jgi:hypothetical protein